ncbi:hypothetical protein GCM10007981_17060 [Thermocladium modestius]|uniref:DUF1922 domain-containing protein n=1 Tax=Thermocladium modestius TaxID=62609 RepID=A0A830GX90_9CREN|nr:DUF1922 domain-containing protein [Thermocladium modestius]GGP22151.1 hypothetical protein GCM10007981_17060 [Thermocladium modestius]
MEYLVLLCPRCGRPSAARARSRSHSCPYCGATFQIAEATLVERAPSGREAQSIIRKLLEGSAK